MVHINEPLLLIGKSSPFCRSGFRLWLSEWFFTIGPTYNRKHNVLSVALNKHLLPSFLLSMYNVYYTQSKIHYIRNVCSLNSLLEPMKFYIISVPQ